MYMCVCICVFVCSSCRGQRCVYLSLSRRLCQVLIAAHGNSLRALVKYLDGVSEADITELNIPTGE